MPILTQRKAFVGLVFVGIVLAFAYWYIEREMRRPYEEMSKQRRASSIENQPPKR